MRQTRTIRFRLSSALLMVFALMALMVLVGLWRLTDYHQAAAEIHDRYLPATQVLGDLSTLTAEYRTLEAEGRSDQEEMAQIDSKIAGELSLYEALPPQPASEPYFRDFTAKWRSYRRLSGQSLAVSRAAYDAAADALWTLNERNRLAADNASRRTERSYADALWLTIAAILLAAMILAGGLAHIRRAILAPLDRLAAAMRRLAANDLAIGPLEPDRTDEIGELTRAVEIFRRNAVALREKLAEERKLTELQRNFVAMASHEFRTPLTVIDGHAQRLLNRREQSDGAEVAERAGKIRQAVARMTGVISSLIDSTRLSEQGAIANFARFDLGQLLRELCQLYRDMTPRLRILENIPAESLTMSGDAKLIFQLFSNILSNAAKYSPDAGEIQVTAARSGDQMMVGIQDHGMGIPDEDRDRLFDRYFRGSNVAGTVGTGIGLHLVRIVLDLHGGTIDIASRQDEGTLFTVTLPVTVTCRSIEIPAEQGQ